MKSTFKIRVEEIIIGGLLGVGFGYSVTAPLLLLTGHALPSLNPWTISTTEPASLAKLVAIIIALAGPIGGILGGLFSGRQTSDQHRRGARYESDPARACDRLQKIETARFSAPQKSKKVRGLVVGGVELSRSRETAHILLLGKPDSGKTVLLRGVLGQVLARGDRCIIHDPKGDFVSTHGERSDTAILGPWDSRSVLWDAAQDIDSPALADEFAASLCGVAGSGQNKYFHSGAAAILGGLIKSQQCSGRWTWASLMTALNGDPVGLIEQAARGDSRVRQAMPSVFVGGRMSTGELAVLSTLGNAIQPVQNLAAVESGRPDALRFSFRAWLTGSAHSGIRCVILNSNALYRAASEQIFSAFLAVISATISAELPEVDPDAKGRGLWLIADEAPQLGRDGLNYLLTIQEVGRSRGVRCVLAAQDASQFVALLGRDKSTPFTRMQGVKLILKVDDAAAAEIVRDIGDREIQRITTTAQAGAIQGKTSAYARVPVLTTSAITGLKRTPHGPQLLMQLDDAVGLLVQPYGGRPVRDFEAFAPCAFWRSQRSIEAPGQDDEPTIVEQTPEAGPLNDSPLSDLPEF